MSKFRQTCLNPASCGPTSMESARRSHGKFTRFYYLVRRLSRVFIRITEHVCLWTLASRQQYRVSAAKEPLCTTQYPSSLVAETFLNILNILRPRPGKTSSHMAPCSFCCSDRLPAFDIARGLYHTDVRTVALVSEDTVLQNATIEIGCLSRSVSLVDH